MLLFCQDDLELIKKMNHDYELRFYLAFQKYREYDYEKSREIVEQLIKEQPQDAEVIHLLGMINFEQGKYTDALEQYETSIHLDPHKEYFYNNLTQLLIQMGNIELLLDKLQIALQLLPDSAIVNYNLGKVYEAQEDDENAFKYYKKAIELDPEFVEALKVFGCFLNAHEQFELALHHYKKLIELDKDNSDIGPRINAGNCFYELQYYDNAKDMYEEALKIDSTNKFANAGLAACLYNESEHQRAHELLDRALETDPGYSNAVSLKANLYVLDGEYEKAYEILKPQLASPEPSTTIITAFRDIALKLGMTEQIISMLKAQIEKAKKNESSSLKASLYFSLGSILDKQKDYKNAFEYIDTANHIKKSNYSHHDDLDKFSKSFEFYTKNKFNELPHATNHSKLPIFIVGMPRSGTTLTEQILSMHPEIHGAGELVTIGKFVQTIQVLYKTKTNYPDAILELNSNDLDIYANEHLDYLHTLAPEAKYVVDKMPHNFQYVGLIKLLYPNSKIIHCIRDPHDTALSIYFQNFMGKHPYSYNLEHIAFHIGTYLNYMKLWKEILGIEIHDVVYEEMIENQEQVSRRLIDFVGVEWDDSCLDFHKSSRTVTTASYEQVKKPIYKSSKQKWKRYEEEMKPFTDMLNKILI